MKEFQISDKEAGQRMDKFLFKVLDQAPKSFVYKMLRKKNIVLNDKKASGQEALKEKDTIKIYLSDETFAKFASAIPQKKMVSSYSHMSGKSLAVHENKYYKKDELADDTIEKKKAAAEKENGEINIVYEDNDILVINKPAGILSQKASSQDYSANEMIIDYLLESGQLTQTELRTFHPSVCNRLDRNTSGLLIAGKTIRGLQDMAVHLKDRSMKKYYRALVYGKIKEPSHITGYLVKDHKTNKVFIKKNGLGDFIETAYRPISHFGNCTLLEVHLITGRSHQIRAHLASVGHPILGDIKYGNRAINQKLKKELNICGQLLHAFRVELPDGRMIQADEPDTFYKVEKWMEKKNGTLEAVKYTRDDK